eukprot:2764987-Amphidinium_carterae.1
MSVGWSSNSWGGWKKIFDPAWRADVPIQKGNITSQQCCSNSHAGVPYGDSCWQRLRDDWVHVHAVVPEFAFLGVADDTAAALQYNARLARYALPATRMRDGCDTGDWFLCQTLLIGEIFCVSLSGCRASPNSR